MLNSSKKKSLDRLPVAISINHPIYELYPNHSKENIYPEYLKKYIKENYLKILSKEINISDNGGNALIHHAAKNGDLILLKLLLNHGAYINKKTQYARSLTGNEQETALSLVLKQIEKEENETIKDKLQLVKTLLLDYGADRKPLGMKKKKEQKIEKKQREEEEKLGETLLREKNRKDNDKKVRDCGDGDERLEIIYENFYKYLRSKLHTVIAGLKSGASGLFEMQKPTQSKLIEFLAEILPLSQLPIGSQIDTAIKILLKIYNISCEKEQITNLKLQADHFIDNEHVDDVIRDYSARVVEFFREDIIIPDSDLGHDLNYRKESHSNKIKYSLISGFTGISKDEVIKSYSTNGENIIQAHWNQLAASAIMKFLKYLSSNHVSYNKNLVMKITENWIPNWSKEKMSFNSSSNKSLGQFDMKTACNLAEITELSYESQNKIRFFTKKWGFEIVSFRQSDLFKSIVMHDGENLIIAFRGTYHKWNWINNINILHQDLQVRDENVVIHKGFYEALMMHWSRTSNGDKQNLPELPLEWAIQELLDQKPNLKIYITGHSLGGAIAANAYLQLLNMKVNGELINLNQISLYTYGQPLWCTSKSTEKLKKFFNENYYRFANYQDLVPTVPFDGIGYEHLGRLYYLHKDNSIIDQHDYDQIFEQQTDKKKISQNILAKIYYIENHSMNHYTKKLQTGNLKTSSAVKLDRKIDSQPIVEPEKKEKSDNPFGKKALGELKKKLDKLGLQNKIVTSAIKTKEVKNKPKIKTEVNKDKLLKQKADDLKSSLSQKMKKFQPHDKQTMLYKACWEGDLEQVKTLYEEYKIMEDLCLLGDFYDLEYNLNSIDKFEHHMEKIKELYLKNNRLLSFKNILRTVFSFYDREYPDVLYKIEFVKPLNSGEFESVFYSNMRWNFNELADFLECILNNRYMTEVNPNLSIDPLHLAIISGNTEIVHFFIDNKIYKFDKFYEYISNESLLSMIQSATYVENYDIIWQIISKFSICIKDFIRFSHIEINYSLKAYFLSSEIKKILSQHFFDYGEDKLYDFLEAFPHKNKSDTVKCYFYLLRKNFYSSLTPANFKKLEELLKKRPDIIDEYKYSLHHSAKKGSLDIVKLLLDIKPELINVLDEYGNNVLHYAVSGDNPDILRLLMARANNKLIDSRNENGKTCLDQALRLNKPDCVIEIAPYKKDISILNTTARKIDDTKKVADSYYKFLINFLQDDRDDIFSQALEKSFKHNPFNLSVALIVINQQINLDNNFIKERDINSFNAFKEGVNLILKKNYQEALEIFINISSSLDKKAELSMAIAYCQVKLQEFEMAENSLQIYADLSDLNSTSAAYYFFLKGEITLQGKDFITALNYFKQALELDKAFIEAKINIGRIYYIVEDYRSSVACFEQLLNSKVATTSLDDEIEKTLENSKISLYLQTEDLKMQTFSMLQNKLSEKIMFNIMIDAFQAGQWLIKHLPQLIHSENIPNLDSLDYGKNLLSPEGIIKNQYSFISYSLPVTRRTLSIKKAIEEINKHGLHSEHPYFKTINDNLNKLYTLKNLLANTPEIIHLEELKKHAVMLINKLELYYKCYINEVIQHYGKNYQNELNNDRNYVLDLYKKAEEMDMLSIERVKIHVEDGRIGYLYKDVEKVLIFNPKESSLIYAKHKIL